MISSLSFGLHFFYYVHINSWFSQTAYSGKGKNTVVDLLGYCHLFNLK